MAVARRAWGGAALGVAFVLLALVTRLPFQDRTLFISDSVRYALALEHYDISVGRPHPPGNPLYVAAVGGIDRLVHDPGTSLALFSALASGIALLFAFLLARDLAGEGAGWLAVALLAVSPLFWFFGAVGMPATGEAALSLLVAWLARRARPPDERTVFWILTLVVAAAFGFRSTFAVLVLPLWAFAARRHSWSRIAAGCLTLVGAAFGWAAWVAARSGGWEAYQATMSGFMTEVVLATKILGGGVGKVPTQAVDITTSALWGLGPFVVPFLIGLVGCCIGRPPFPAAATFLVAWSLPMALFHIAYDWAPRFGVLLLPPAVILAAATAIPLAQWLARGRASVVAGDLPTGALPRALVLAGLAVNLALFLLPVQIGGWALPARLPTGPALLARNDDLARRDATLRTALPAHETLILAYDHAFHAAWFLPDFRVVGLFPVFQDAADTWVPSARGRQLSMEAGSTALPPDNPLPLPPEVRRVVLYDPEYLAYWPPELPATALEYDRGRSVPVATLPGPGCLAWGRRSIQFLPRGATGCPA